MNEIIFIFLGLFAALIVDIIWWVKPALSKSDKFKLHEHYHIALELILVFIVIEHYTHSSLSLILFGAAVGFLLGEWDQLKEIKNKKVIPGHPFAYGSTHFKSSSILGIILVGIIILALYI